MTPRGVRPFTAALLMAMEGVLGLVNCYLLALLAAATSQPRRPIRPAPDSTCGRFAVVIPAHDEETGISATLDSLRALDYPRERFELVVIADNCRDRTASVAATAGATVWERDDPSHRGKGHALAWAFKRLNSERPGLDAVAVVDADCEASPELLLAMDRALQDGASAVQVDNVVSNPGESPASALRYAAFVLMNTVRPLGKSRLGFSCGLFGTGMGFTCALLERHPWGAFSVAEDREYHLRVVAAGERVAFAPEAAVRGAMPISLASASQQQLRWEGGSWAQVPEWTRKLLTAGLRERDPVRLHAALETLIPPQSLLALGHLTLAVGAVGLRSQPGAGLAVINVVGQLVFVLGGLRLTRAPAEAYRGLAHAPMLIAQKVGIYARLVAGRGSRGWVRTRRRPASRALPTAA
jgi:hypothetical protein